MGNGFTKHCLERMSTRNISMEEMATVLAMGFFRNQPTNKTYAVEYGRIVVVVGYDCNFVTTYKIAAGNKYSHVGLCEEPRKHSRQHRLEVLKIADLNREIRLF